MTPWSEKFAEQWRARPTHLDELGVHQLRGTHPRPLVHLAVVDQLLAAIHRLIVGARLWLDHVGGLHAREGRVAFDRGSARQHHGIGLRQVGVHVNLGPEERHRS